ncbi:hypothetical protein [Tenacibaculum sp. SZ-18]|uniref:hypothetical protein n=1 Tax=Tenacibaculum sp. SZ-18 TaxID=754423 RepID=UPI0012FE3153|nr:hypothetical protein [Tenacibaculum sp. SZ-18]
MKKYFYLILSVLIVSCYTLPQKTKFYQAYNSVDLGVIGEQKKTVRKNGFEVSGIPTYLTPIKLDFSAKSFDKQNFKSYNNFLKTTTKKQIVNFVDSLEFKPKYFEFKINDKISVVDQIEEKQYNTKVKRYLYYNPELTLITQIKFVANTKIVEQLKQGEAFYLQTKDNNQSHILVYKKGKVIQDINTSELQVFQYDVASFCWNVDELRGTDIVGLVEEGELCLNKSVRNPIEELEKRKKARIEFDY